MVLISCGIRRPSPHLFVCHPGLILLIRGWLVCFCNHAQKQQRSLGSPPPLIASICSSLPNCISLPNPECQRGALPAQNMHGSVLYLYLISLQIWRQRRFLHFLEISCGLFIALFSSALPVKLSRGSQVKIWGRSPLWSVVK